MLYQRNKPFRAPLQVRLSYMLVSTGWFRIFPLIGAIVLLALASWGLMWLYSVLTFSTSIFKDVGFVGLFGSLFGALLGSIIGAIVSLRIQSQQSRAAASIKKKEQIYVPLYKELIDLKDQLIEYPHPRYIWLFDETKGKVRTPHFTEWNKIKSDSRLIEIPIWIKNTLEQYTDGITNYYIERDRAVGIVEDTIVEFMMKHYNLMYRSIPEAGLSMFQAIIQDDPDTMKLILTTQFNERNKYDPIFDFAAKKIINVGKEIPIVKQTIENYDRVIVKRTNWIIEELSNVINYINMKYENHERHI